MVFQAILKPVLILCMMESLEVSESFGHVMIFCRSGQKIEGSSLDKSVVTYPENSLNKTVKIERPEDGI